MSASLAFIYLSAPLNAKETPSGKSASAVPSRLLPGITTNRRRHLVTIQTRKSGSLLPSFSCYIHLADEDGLSCRETHCSEANVTG